MAYSSSAFDQLRGPDMAGIQQAIDQAAYARTKDLQAKLDQANAKLRQAQAVQASYSDTTAEVRYGAPADPKVTTTKKVLLLCSN